MPQPNVCDLLKDQRFEGFLLVRSSDQRTGGNGAKYLDLNLADRTGEVNAKVWDGNVPLPRPAAWSRCAAARWNTTAACSCAWSASVP